MGISHMHNVKITSVNPVTLCIVLSQLDRKLEVFFFHHVLWKRYDVNSTHKILCVLSFISSYTERTRYLFKIWKQFISITVYFILNCTVNKCTWMQDTCHPARYHLYPPYFYSFFFFYFPTKNTITEISRAVLWHFTGKCWSFSEPIKGHVHWWQKPGQCKAALVAEMHQNKEKRKKKDLKKKKGENLSCHLRLEKQLKHFHFHLRQFKCWPC